jgi:hypothetical protein
MPMPRILMACIEHRERPWAIRLPLPPGMAVVCRAWRCSFLCCRRDLLMLASRPVPNFPLYSASFRHSASCAASWKGPGSRRPPRWGIGVV